MAEYATAVLEISISVRTKEIKIYILITSMVSTGVVVVVIDKNNMLYNILKYFNFRIGYPQTLEVISGTR